MVVGLASLGNAFNAVDIDTQEGPLHRKQQGCRCFCLPFPGRSTVVHSSTFRPPPLADPFHPPFPLSFASRSPFLSSAPYPSRQSSDPSPRTAHSTSLHES